MNKKIGILLSIVIIAILVLTVNNVFATSQDLNTLLADSADNEFTQIQQGTTGTNSATGNVNSAVDITNQNSISSLTPTNTTNTLNTINTVNSVNTTNKIGNNTSLPQTGIDSTLTVMIGICVVSILFAYTKIRKSDI